MEMGPHRSPAVAPPVPETPRAVSYLNLTTAPPRTSLVAKTVKCLSAMRETWVQSLGLKIPWRRKQQPTPVLLPRKSHGRRSLVQATVHGVAKSRARLSDFPSPLLHSPSYTQGAGVSERFASPLLHGRAQTQALSDHVLFFYTLVGYFYF